MGKYSAAWKRYRHIQAWFLSWWLGGLVLPFLLLLNHASSLTQANRQVLIFSYLGLWLAGTFYWRIRLSRFRCPRCSQYFVGNSRVPLVACPHCGLKRYQDA